MSEELSTAAAALLDAFDAYDRALRRYGTLGRERIESRELDRLYVALADAAEQLRRLLDAG